jgi:hypothetical protein
MRRADTAGAERNSNCCPPALGAVTATRRYRVDATRLSERGKLSFVHSTVLPNSHSRWTTGRKAESALAGGRPLVGW